VEEGPFLRALPVFEGSHPRDISEMRSCQFAKMVRMASALFLVKGDLMYIFFSQWSIVAFFSTISPVSITKHFSLKSFLSKSVTISKSLLRPLLMVRIFPIWVNVVEKSHQNFSCNSGVFDQFCIDTKENSYLHSCLF
jgi:hypothetical protein